ncbi:MAG: hypothetical protein A3G81_02770 [Betaproteobacteria bacterium RIFCSPLOWO2_12_FULL_65_14]|nr:MAG: hypothetical protein A3G81_02770 [Betaproteobacteria bacterium RIFCSPLOWO2_12_FULL_65_14]
MKRKLIAAAMAAAFFAAPAWAQRGAHDEHHAPGGQKPLAQRDAGMMGGGMMGSHSAVDLSDDQRAKIADIQRELAGKQRDLMTKMHDQQLRMHDLLAPGSVDEAGARKAYEEMTSARKEMFEATLEARQRIAAVLTGEQRKQLRSSSSCMTMEKQS